MKEILIAAIPNLLTLIGVIVTVEIGNRRTKDIMEYRLQQLEKKQDQHNNLIDRMYKAETDIEVNKNDIKVANHRIEDLENKAS